MYYNFIVVLVCYALTYVLMFFLSLYCAHRDLHVLTPSFPTRRSSVLVNNYAHVRPAVREAVTKAIAELGYRPNGLASSFRTQQSNIVGVLLRQRSEEHTSELQSLRPTSYAVFWLKRKNKTSSKRI